MDNRLKIFNVKWTSRSAGPSPDSNKRTEVFLAGCHKAASGNPCPGCFNQELWQEDGVINKCTVDETFDIIKRYAPNRYITFVGGEPLDQIEPLAELCEKLKKDNFNIIVITHYTLGHILNKCVREIVTAGYINNYKLSHKKLLQNVDAIIDGEYDQAQRIWDDSRAGDGLHDVVGSANQIIWNTHGFYTKKLFSVGDYPPGYKAGMLDSWQMDNNDNFIFVPLIREEAMVA